MRVEKLFSDYMDSNGEKKNDVYRKAGMQWYHHGDTRYRVESMSVIQMNIFLEAITNNQPDISMNAREIIVLLISPKKRFMSLERNMSDECILLYRHSSRVGLLNMTSRRSTDALESQWRVTAGRNFSNDNVFAYCVCFEQSPILNDAVLCCQDFFNLNFQPKTVAQWQRKFQRNIKEARLQLVEEDILTDRNVSENQAIILLFLGKSFWHRISGPTEHAVMFYREKIYEDSNKKFIYVSLYPNYAPELKASGRKCYPPDFHSFRKDQLLIQGAGDNQYQLEAYRITFPEPLNAIEKIHAAYKSFLLSNESVQFERWSHENRASAYLPSSATEWLLCYWGAGCAWLECCFTKPTYNCVSLIVRLLGETKIYTSASAYAQRQAIIGHIVFIIAAGIFASESNRLSDVTYPVEKSNQVVKDILLFMGVIAGIAACTYGFNEISAYLPRLFCGLSVESAAKLPTTVYLVASFLCLTAAAMIFIVRGAEHGFSRQKNKLEHVPVIWGMFGIGAIVIIAIYGLFSLFASENFSCSRPYTLHKDLERMSYFSLPRPRNTGLRLENDLPQYRPPPEEENFTGTRNTELVETTQLSHNSNSHFANSTIPLLQNTTNSNAVPAVNTTV